MAEDPYKVPGRCARTPRTTTSAAPSASSPRSCTPTSIRPMRTEETLQEGLRRPTRSSATPRSASNTTAARSTAAASRASGLPPVRTRGGRAGAARRRPAGSTSSASATSSPTCSARPGSAPARGPFVSGPGRALHAGGRFPGGGAGAKKRVTLPDGGMLDLTVPEGVADGQVLRLKGKGQRGAARRRAGRCAGRDPRAAARAVQAR